MIKRTTEEPQETAHQAQEATEEPAVGSEDELEYAEISWHFIGAEQPDQEMVFEAANKIIKEEINANVNFIRLGWGDYEEKMQLMTAAERRI